MTLAGDCTLHMWNKSWQTVSRPNFGGLTMAEYHHGEMDVQEQEKTFHGFLKVGRISLYICIGILVFLAVFNS